MRRIYHTYLGKFLNGEYDTELLRFKIGYHKEMSQVCAELVTKLANATTLQGKVYPPEPLPAELLYTKVRECLADEGLSRYAAGAVVMQSNWTADWAKELIGTLCQDKPEYLLKIIVYLSSYPGSPANTIAAIHQLLEAADQSVWLDAATTIKTKKELYHFTKWPTVLKKLPKRDRGLILEGELGL
jgi:hypothetical protein